MIENMEFRKIGSLNRYFSENIVNKYSDHRVSTEFTPVISTKKISSHVDLLDMIYSFSFMVLQYGIVNSFLKTANTLKSVKNVFNVYLNIDFLFFHSKSDKILKNQFLAAKDKDSVFKMYKFYSSAYEFFFQFLNYNKSVVFLEDSKFDDSNIIALQKFAHYDFKKFNLGIEGFLSLKREISIFNQFFTHLNHENSFIFGKSQQHFFSVIKKEMRLIHNIPERIEKETKEIKKLKHQSSIFARLLHPLMHNESLMAVQGEKSYIYSVEHQKNLVSNGIKKAKIENIELTVFNRNLPVITRPFNSGHKMFPEIYKQLEENITSFRPYSMELQRQLYYQFYPEIEHLKSRKTEVVKEKIVEKEIAPETQYQNPKIPEIDLNRFADTVYQLIERKMRIEKERRGLLSI